MRLSTSHLTFSDSHRFERYVSGHLHAHLELMEQGPM